MPILIDFLKDGVMMRKSNAHFVKEVIQIIIGSKMSYISMFDSCLAITAGIMSPYWSKNSIFSDREQFSKIHNKIMAHKAITKKNLSSMKGIINFSEYNVCNISYEKIPRALT